MPTELDLETPPWIAPDPRDVVLQRVQRRGRTLRWQRRLPAAGAGLALAVVLAATALPTSAPPHELHMADHPGESSPFVDEEPSAEQGPVSASGDIEGYTGPPGAEARARARAGSAGAGAEVQAGGRPTIALTAHPLMTDDGGDVRQGDLVSTGIVPAPEVDILVADVQLVREALVFRVEVEDLEAFRRLAEDGTELTISAVANGPHSTGIEVGVNLSRALGVNSTWAALYNGHGTGRMFDGAAAVVDGSAIEISVSLASVNQTMQHEVFAPNRADGDPTWRPGTRLSDLGATARTSKRLVTEYRPDEVRRDEVYAGAEYYWVIGT